MASIPETNSRLSGRQLSQEDSQFEEAVDGAVLAALLEQLGVEGVMRMVDAAQQLNDISLRQLRPSRNLLLLLLVKHHREGRELSGLIVLEVVVQSLHQQIYCTITVTCCRHSTTAPIVLRPARFGIMFGALIALIMVECMGGCWEKVEKWLFDYPGKIENSIHSSSFRRALLIIRVSALLILTFRYVLEICLYKSLFQIAKYLTDFSLWMSWAYFALVCQHSLLEKGQVRCKRQWLYGCRLSDWTVLLFEAAICLQAIVVLFFWSMVYDYSQPFELMAFAKEVGVHAFPFLCLLADLSINTHPFPKHHLLPVFVVGCVYMAVNASFSLVVEPIYYPLDWVSTMSYVYLLACHLIGLTLHTLIRKYWQKHRRPNLQQALTSEETASSDANINA